MSPYLRAEAGYPKDSTLYGDSVSLKTGNYYRDASTKQKKKKNSNSMLVHYLDHNFRSLFLRDFL